MYMYIYIRTMRRVFAPITNVISCTLSYRKHSFAISSCAVGFSLFSVIDGFI